MGTTSKQSIVAQVCARCKTFSCHRRCLFQTAGGGWGIGVVLIVCGALVGRMQEREGNAWGTLEPTRRSPTVNHGVSLRE